MTSGKIKIVDAEGFQVYAVEIVEGVKSLYMPEAKNKKEKMKNAKDVKKHLTFKKHFNKESVCSNRWRAVSHSILPQI